MVPIIWCGRSYCGGEGQGEGAEVGARRLENWYRDSGWLSNSAF